MSRNVDWDEDVQNFEKHDPLSLKKGEELAVTFKDDGKFVSKKDMENADVEYARDSFVFTVDTKDGLKAFWVGAKSFSVMNQIKKLRDDNGKKLTGLRAKITRVSDKKTETNYEVVAQ